MKTIPHRVLLPLLAGAALALAADSRPTFPLKVSQDHRYLTDSAGAPFLIVGDTAWSLIAQLEQPDVAKYLDDRRQKGFNAIIVNLIEAKYATHAPNTRAGIAPFLISGDFSTPNPAYFDWAHDCLAAANARGIAVFLCPAYLGWGGGDEGFHKIITNQPAARLRGYGRFAAERFKDLPNIVWMPGGDYSMPEPERWTVHELAAGIREADTARLMTGHAGQKSPRTAFGDPPWVQVDNSYSYEPALWKQLQADALREPRMPVFLSETTYEGEHQATPQQIRRQAWWAMLSGHCGQFFGNNPIWHFDGPGLFPVNTTWQEAINSPGSRDIARLGGFFQELPWTELIPDTTNQLVPEPGEGTLHIAGASKPDGRLAVLYLPAARGFTVNLSKLELPIAAHWFDPTDGKDQPVAGSPFASKGKREFTPPPRNAAGESDWVLVFNTPR